MDLSVEKICKILKLNPARYYSWKKKYENKGMQGLENKKSKPENCPHKLLDKEKEIIIDYALKNPDTRHRKLAYEMQNKGVAYVSPSSVYRILKENNLIPKKSYHQEKKADGKMKVTRPNKLWHTDITYIKVDDEHAYLISVLDAYSRYIIHFELSRTMTAKDMKRVLNKAMYKTGMFEKQKKPILISDNGTQLVAKSFKEFLREWNIKHIRTANKHPETNGKIEIFHKTLKHEHIYVQEKYHSFYQAEKDISKFIYEYNHKRLHQGIGFVTPYQRYNLRGVEIKKKRKYKHKLEIDRRKRINRKNNLAVA